MFSGLITTFHTFQDRLWKIRPVFECFTKQFRAIYTPTKNVCVDETLFHYRGRHNAVHFIPSKRARFGLKAFKLCQSDGEAGGYTVSMKLVMGDDPKHPPAFTRIPLELLDSAGLSYLGYEMYTDNWYTSPTLFHQLQARKTGAVGTVKTTRRFMPRDLNVTKPGDVDFRCVF